MAKKNNICIYNAQLVDKNIDCNGMIIIQEEKILAVLQGFFSKEQAISICKNITKAEETDTDFIDAKNCILQPAFIDLHAHFRYPGQTEKEDLSSGLHSAVAGGFGTLVLMPNTNPVVSTVEDSIKICKEAAKYNLADIFQTISLTRNFDGKDTSHLDELQKYNFNLPSTDGGIPIVTEDGRDVEFASKMLEAMKKCAKKNITVSCHSEDFSLAAEARPLRMEALKLLEENTPQKNIEAFELLEKANELLTLAEDIATERNIQLATKANCSVHIAHVSTKGSIESIKYAKKTGKKVTCEVTPHHLGLSVSSKDENLRHLVNPPIRKEEDRLTIIEAIKNGTVDAIATDHAPHTTQDKNNGAPGFTGLETAYAVCNMELVQSGFISRSKLSALMAANPAEILGISKGETAKGYLLPGFMADLIICDEQKDWIVEPEKFYSKGKYTPLKNKHLKGKVLQVIHHGKKIFPFE